MTLLLMLAGCESDFTVQSTQDAHPPVETTGTITGRVCDPAGFTWLEGATVYSNLADPDGLFYDMLLTETDADGYWSLEEVPVDVPLTFYVQHGGTMIDEHHVTLFPGEFLRLDEPDCFDPTVLDIAVVTGDFDDFDEVLEGIGVLDYTLIDGGHRGQLESFLLDPDAMAEHDLIFFNGGCIESGIFYDLDDADNPIPPQVIANVQAYVEQGGFVYASDWAYDIVEQAWPDKLDFLGVDHVPDSAQLGNAQVVQASISNEVLGQFLDDEDGTMQVLYDLPVWPPLEQVSHTVSTHLLGTVTYREAGVDIPIPSSPMMVSFNGGGGKVVFSTFRLAANIDDQMLLMWKYALFEL